MPKDGDQGSWEWEKEKSGSSDSKNARSKSHTLVKHLRWFTNTDKEWIVFIREALSSVAVVVVVGLILFVVSGVWPPMVAVASGSMTPHMQTNDMVFVTGEHRFTGDGVHANTGIVTYQTAKNTEYTTFHEAGNVIVYEPYGNSEKTRIIHRARFWVNGSENWYRKANPDYVGTAENCKQLSFCPAPHSGFITKGDANSNYDQIAPPGDDAISSPVKPKWVTGTAQFRIPWLGKVRLALGQMTISEQTNSALLHPQEISKALASTISEDVHPAPS